MRNDVMACVRTITRADNARFSSPLHVVLYGLYFVIYKLYVYACCHRINIYIYRTYFCAPTNERCDKTPENAR